MCDDLSLVKKKVLQRWQYIPTNVSTAFANSSAEAAEDISRDAMADEDKKISVFGAHPMARPRRALAGRPIPSAVAWRFRASSRRP